MYWYQVSKRDLPFRDTQDPYKIWLSEIILQQTRVNQGLPYYNKFITLFPTVENLANAEEMEVMNAWQGLGYYSRARNLHYTAKFVVNELEGVFPTAYNDLIKLKGIGDDTASAISSFAAKEVRPALDGNVYRFISRLYGVDTPINTPKSIKDFKKILNELIDEKNPDIFNQAMIEFGALQCTPKSPDCENCVFSDSCHAFLNNAVFYFPVKMKKKKSIDRFLSFYFIKKNNSTFILKRTENSIWQNLYEFPNIESKKLFDNEELSIELLGEVEIISIGKTIKHILSHQNIYAKVFSCSTLDGFLPQDNWIEININEFDNYPLHRLMEKMLEQ